MPRLTEIPPGCANNPRCPFAEDRCRRERPEAIPTDAGTVACHAVEEVRLPPLEIEPPALP